MKFNLLVVLALGLSLSGCTKSEDSKSQPPLGEATLTKQDAKGEAKELTPDQTVELYEKVGAKLAATMLQCPSRIWPDYNWKTVNVLMLQSKENPSFVWRGETGKLEPLAESEIPEGSRNGLYSFWKWKDQDAVSIFLESESSSYFANEKELLGLVIHEGFHSVGQRAWAPGAKTRGTVYPIDAKPRFYRRMILERLKTYFQSQGKETKALGQAAFWYQKWKTDYSSEIQATTDDYEGTALYVEKVGGLIAEKGCDVSEEELMKAAQNLVSEDYQFRMDSNRLALDSEGYPVGGLSSLILRLVQKDSGWYQKVKERKTPLQLLLDDVKPTEDVADPSIEKEYETSASTLNLSLSAMFGTDVENFLKAETVRIAVPGSAIHASFSPRGFYLPQSLPGYTVVPLASDFPFQGADWNLTAKADSNVFSGASPCPKASYIAVASPADVSSSANELKVSTAKLVGTIKGEWKKDSQNRDWFCGN